MIGNIEQILSFGEKMSETNNQINFVKKIITNYYGLKDENDLMLKTRQRKYITPRHNAMYLLSKLLKVTSVDIGAVFNCDHSTVLHAIKKVEGFLMWDDDLRKELNELERIIKLKNLAIDTKGNIENEFYFIDLNNFISIKGNNNKSIILSGFTMEEVNNMKNINITGSNRFEHKSTGLYILEKKNGK